MIEKIQDAVIHAIQKASPKGEWRELRTYYFWYSYLAFITVSVHYLDKEMINGDGDGILEYAENRNLIDHIISDYLKTLPRYKEILREVCQSLDEPFDITILYQQYISSDFHVLPDHTLTFEKGKNGKDILGAYYTESEFAYEITKKALDDLTGQTSGSVTIDDIKKRVMEMRILDSSCGAGEFLVSVIRYCKIKFGLDPASADKLADHLYGVDADPLAVLITKVRLMRELGMERASDFIILGNPLLTPADTSSVLDRYIMASEGRYYNQTMGIHLLGQSFDLILGNPPWEKIRFEEKKFLSHFIENADLIRQKNDRAVFIQSALCDADKTYYYDIKNDYETFKKVHKNANIFRYSTAGEVNTYAMFTELSSLIRTNDGLVILIVKSSLIKAPVYKDFFKYLITDGHLREIYMFTNKNKIFQIDSREEFAVIVLGGHPRPNLQIAVNLDNYKNFANWGIEEISRDFLHMINPMTGMMPNVKSREEIDFLSHIYQSNRTFADVYPECKFGRLVHLTNHSDYILKYQADDYLPIYEGKFIELYTGKYATFDGMADKEKYSGKASALPISNPEGAEYPQSRYFINESFWNELSKNFHEPYSIMWRSLTSATNKRTMLATLLPHMPACQSLQFLQLPSEDPCLLLQILALFNSVIFDYIVRLKMAGLDLTQTIIKQIPVPEQSRYHEELVFKEKKDTIGNHIYCRVRYLYRSENRLNAFFEQLNLHEIENHYSRKEVIADIDKLVARAYLLDNRQLKYIVKTFDKFYLSKEADLWF